MRERKKMAGVAMAMLMMAMIGCSDDVGEISAVGGSSVTTTPGVCQPGQACEKSKMDVGVEYAALEGVMCTGEDDDQPCMDALPGRIANGQFDGLCLPAVPTAMCMLGSDDAWGCFAPVSLGCTATTKCTADSQCADGDACTTDICSSGGQCFNVGLPDNEGGTCTDGDACTENDMCTTGTCAGTSIVCDDGNGCTDDACTDGACAFTNNMASCDDGFACTENDTCVVGICVGVPNNLLCPDANDCTDDVCDPTNEGASSAGCLWTNNTASCDDSVACTTGDVCSGGMCMGTVDDSLCVDDGNKCTIEFCHPTSGCTAGNASAGSLCGPAMCCDGGVDGNPSMCSGSACP